MTALQPHFLPGTYDLLRKNCNSFSDCALAYLLGMRLDDKYRAPEKLGAQWDKYIGIVRNFSGGCYQPNPLADGFQSCKVVGKLGTPIQGKDRAAGQKDINGVKVDQVGRKDPNAFTKKSAAKVSPCT